MKNYSPITEAMKEYSLDGALAFHTPGHKQGLGAHDLLKELITTEGLRREVSLMEELDDLNDPRACIKKAQDLAAELWNADEAFFMINGTTSAVQAMMMSTLQPGDMVLVPRNAHRCVMGGLILSGARPIYLMPEFDFDFGISLNLSLKVIKLAIEKYPQAKALVIVSPNYYGISADLSAISQLLHEHGMMLLVDEAHGVHLHFNDELPISAMDANADLAAQSTHKLLGSLTQTSMLMVKSKLVDIDRVKQVTSLLQSTSPNYLLLASLDIARLQMQESGEKYIKRTINLSRQLCREIDKIHGLRTLKQVEGFSRDITKVTVNVEGLGLTGIEAEKILRYEYKIQCELSDTNNVLFLITYADTENEINRLLGALKRLSNEHTNESCIIQSERIYKRHDNLKLISIPSLTPREAFYRPSVSVDLRDSVNKICAEEVTFYPPGIPLIYPGEMITNDIIEMIVANKKIGRRLIGTANTNLGTIKILSEF